MDAKRSRMGSPPGAKGELLPHVSALDGLRFFAFLAVYVHHAAQNNERIRHLTEYGGLGVQVFFVLSGFLIGLILLQLRERRDTPLGERLKTFYLRRALRIFPLYYLSLALFALLTASGFELLGKLEHLPWNLAYLTNLKIVLDGRAMGGLSHFWSLSVEEHFYMLAPLLVLTMSRARLPLCCAWIWLGSVVARAALGERFQFVSLLSPLQFDCLAVGIATAVLQTEGSVLGVPLERARKLTLACAPLALLLLAGRQSSVTAVRLSALALDQGIFALAVAGLILHVWNAKGSPLLRLLAFGPFTYLGKISYGLYVWHFPVLMLVAVGLQDVLPRGSSLLALPVTVLVATISWYAFERPINDLKRHFPYRS